MLARTSATQIQPRELTCPKISKFRNLYRTTGLRLILWICDPSDDSSADYLIRDSIYLLIPAIRFCSPTRTHYHAVINRAQNQNRGEAIFRTLRGQVLSLQSSTVVHGDKLRILALQWFIKTKQRRKGKYWDWETSIMDKVKREEREQYGETQWETEWELFRLQRSVR